MRISIALLCYKRLVYLRSAVDSILAMPDLKSIDLYAFVDGPRDVADTLEVDGVFNYLDSLPKRSVFNSYSIIKNSNNIGVWKSKVHAFNYCFEHGSELVLLVEDDVLIARDSLLFIVAAYLLATRHNDKLITISLYSTNLEYEIFGPDRVPIDFINNNVDIYREWGARDWPFPWGLCLDRKNFFEFLKLGWNGNDQHMGALLRENKGADFFPIISRSKHIGKLSSTSGEIIPLSVFPDIVNLNSFHIPFSNLDLDVNGLIRLANYFYTNLNVATGPLYSKVNVIYDDTCLHFESIREFKLRHPYVYVIESPISVRGDDWEKSFHSVLNRMLCTVNIVLIADEQLCVTAIKILKNNGAEVVASSLDIDFSGILRC